MATISQLITAAQEIYNETEAGANTHERIGQMFLDIIDFISSNQFMIDVVSTPPVEVNEGGGYITFFIELNLPLNGFTAQVFAAPPQASGTNPPAFSAFEFLAAGNISPNPDNYIDYSDGLTAWENLFGAMSGYIGQYAWFYCTLISPNGNAITTPRIRGIIAA